MLNEYKGPSLKAELSKLFALGSLDETLAQLLQLPPRRAVNPLFSFLLSSNQIIRWKAVTAMGVVVANGAWNDLEWARIVMRRLIWSLNDESGGIGWGAPEAMAEIMARHDMIANEYSHILVSYIREDGNFLEYEPLQRGAVWGLGRLAQERPGLIRNSVDHLIPFLTSPDNILRGLAVWALGLLQATSARQEFERLLDDESEIEIYIDQELRIRRICDLAKEALLLLRP